MNNEYIKNIFYLSKLYFFPSKISLRFNKQKKILSILYSYIMTVLGVITMVALHENEKTFLVKNYDKHVMEMHLVMKSLCSSLIHTINCLYVENIIDTIVVLIGVSNHLQYDFVKGYNVKYQRAKLLLFVIICLVTTYQALSKYYKLFYDSNASLMNKIPAYIQLVVHFYLNLIFCLDTDLFLMLERIQKECYHLLNKDILYFNKDLCEIKKIFNMFYELNEISNMYVDNFGLQILIIISNCGIYIMSHLFFVYTLSSMESSRSNAIAVNTTLYWVTFSLVVFHSAEITDKVNTLSFHYF